MSSRSEQSPPMMRFFDALFQEQNIKWLLGLGTLILLSSSTMLVTSHWDSYTPLWKYAVLIGYTAIIHVAGQLGYHNLALRKTGTGLMALTVMLIPLTFAAFRWIHPASVLSIDGLLAQSGLLILLCVNSVFSFLAGRRIFQHFLLRTQPTFLACYLALSFFGALLPSLPAATATLFAGIAWFVYTIGSLKVNRHAFWLAEEYRKPRIFGFFPIILLGTQFLLLFATTFAPHVAIEWMGLGLVLTAVPVLLAADTLTRVIQSRSDLETPPLSVSVVVAMILGVAAVLAGVFLSAYGFPGTVALVPTAIVAAIAMGFLARRTQRFELVWMMLLFVVTAYQTSPVFFKELVHRLMDQGATALGEERMPFAFYGITYLPLLVATSLVSNWLTKKERTLFARPLKHFSIALPLLLLPVAFGHAKAIFPVSILISGLFTVQTFLFKDRRLQLAAIVAFLAAAIGSGQFLKTTLDIAQSASLTLSTWVIAGGFLLIPGFYFDRAIKKLPPVQDDWNLSDAAQGASLLILTGTAVVWMMMSVVTTVGVLPGAASFALLVWHSYRYRNVFVSSVTLALPVFFPLVLAQSANWTFANIAFLSAIVLSGISLFGLIMKRNPEWSLSQVFGSASETVSGAGIIIQQLVLIPLMLLGTLDLIAFNCWGASMIVLLVGAELSWRMRSSSQLVLTWIQSLAFLASLMMSYADVEGFIRWVPLAWASFASVAAFIIRRLSDSSNNSESTPESRCLHTIEWCAGLTLGMIAIISLPVFVGALRIAGIVAVAGSFFLTIRRRENLLTEFLLVIANLHLLSFVMQLIAPQTQFLFDVTHHHFIDGGVALALVSAISATFWQSRCHQSISLSGPVSMAMQFLSLPCLLWTVPVAVSSPQFLPVLGGVITLLLLAVIQCRAGLRRMSAYPTGIKKGQPLTVPEIHVWAAMAFLLAAIGYIALTGAFRFHTTVALFVPLGIAAIAYCLSRGCSGETKCSMFSRPLSVTSYLLPACSVFLGVMLHFSAHSILWPGVNSFALLLAGGFYFWRGLEERKPGHLFGAASTLNIALAMLWNDLNWSDPQLFLIPVGISILTLVEVLREQVPNRILNPLRYAGALTILVSPTFEIVGGSWIHLITLMVTSVVIVVVAMGARVKALMYTGTAFLIADLIAIVVRGTIDQPSLLWLAGIAVGAGVIGLAAYCERNREKMLQRIRSLSAELETWN